MPLPKRLTRFNKRFANPIIGRFARFPPLVLVAHRGRVTGRDYRTPVLALSTEDGYVIALTYGLDVDWLKNVVAAGGCTILRRGRGIEVSNPRVVGWAAGSKHLPIPVRVALLGLQVRDFLLLDRAEASTG